MTSPRREHKRSLNKPLYFRIWFQLLGAQWWIFNPALRPVGGCSGRAAGIFSSPPRNLMSCHDVTARSCDPVSAYLLALHLIRKISVTLTNCCSVIQLSSWSSLDCRNTAKGRIQNRTSKYRVNMFFFKKYYLWLTLTAWMLEGKCRWLCCWGCRWRGGVLICQLLPKCRSNHSKHLGLLLQR